MRDKKFIRDVSTLDNTPIFVEISSPGWRNPEKIELKELSKSLLKHTKHPKEVKEGFQLEMFKDQDVSYYTPPQNNLEVKPLIAAIDENYLYIWMAKQKKWKRIPLSDWELE